MKRAFKMLRWVLAVAFAAFLVAQFFGPAKSNPPAEPTRALESHVQVTPQVAAILDRSCNDCHSNKTRWPWYSNVAPVSWFVIGHVNEGRENLNFSEWDRYDQRTSASLLRQVCREVKAGVMPLGSYTPLHAGSKLSEEDVTTLCEWANTERAKIATP